MNSGIFIIAEAGINHNGDINIARKMIDAASIAGADAIKFQTFITENMVVRKSPKADYQKANGNPDQTQFEMLKKLELSGSDFAELKSYCEKKDIVFLSTPFDHESIDILNELKLDIFKVGSGEITNLPYLQHIGKLNKNIILSTGMSTLNEVKTAVNIIEKAGTPKGKITLLHANTEYPTPYEDVNLLAMKTMAEEIGIKTGYSDHTPGIEIAIAAAAMGACVIEKHFTLDRNMSGPDHKASLEPGELKQMILSIRNVEFSLGNGIKTPSKSEIKNIAAARKSIVAEKDIKKGDIFSVKNICVKRPGTGISPLKWNDIIGAKSQKDYKEDDLI